MAAPAPGRALVLGGGGHAGAAFARALLARGWQVAAAARTPGRRAALEGLDAERLTGDAADAATLARWCAGRDLVVDAAAPYPLRPGGADASPAAAARRTEALIGAVRAAGAQLIHVGSFVTLRRGGARARLVRAAHPYFAVKEAMEASLIAAARGGLRATLLNPAALIGPWDCKPSELCFVDAVLSGALRAAPPDPVAVIDVRDAAEAGLRAWEAGFWGVRTPLVGHAPSVAELAARIARAGGVSPPSAAPPLAPGAAALRWSEAALALFGAKSPWPSLPALLTLAGAGMAPLAGRIALGPAPRPLEDSVRDAVAWRRAAGFV